ncbi:MAG: peptide chain release factor N(5)-glutamine methyltransferase, partial [Anaerotignum sp.]|nr:peptide chain release factor N(5)-glutamine methyltransferase [Anaerotignum sp.]
MNQKNKTIGEVLTEAKQRLREAGKEDFSFDAELLLEKAAGLNRTALFLREKEVLSEEAEQRYRDYIYQREQGRPTQYILGEWEFM